MTNNLPIFIYMSKQKGQEPKKIELDKVEQLRKAYRLIHEDLMRVATSVEERLEDLV